MMKKERRVMLGGESNEEKVKVYTDEDSKSLKPENAEVLDGDEEEWTIEEICFLDSPTAD